MTFDGGSAREAVAAEGFCLVAAIPSAVAMWRGPGLRPAELSDSRVGVAAVLLLP